MKKFFYSQIYTLLLTLFFYLLVLLRVKEPILGAFITTIVAILNIYFTPFLIAKIFKDASLAHLIILNATLVMTASIFFIVINAVPKVIGEYLLSAYLSAGLTLVVAILVVYQAFKSLKIEKINLVFTILEILMIIAGFFIIPLIIKI
jgi:hypothetical protein